MYHLLAIFYACDYSRVIEAFLKNTVSDFSMSLFLTLATSKLYTANNRHYLLYVTIAE